LKHGSLGEAGKNADLALPRDAIPTILPRAEIDDSVPGAEEGRSEAWFISASTHRLLSGSAVASLLVHDGG